MQPVAADHLDARRGLEPAEEPLGEYETDEHAEKNRC
jgi:hypothetical protein